MRVICISKATNEVESGNQTAVSENNVSFGAKYEAKNSDIHDDCYIIKGLEYERGLTVHWEKTLFIPLSERDERELAHAEPIESTFILKEL